MDCFKDDKTAGLFLEINPNIDEIAKESEEMKQDADLEHKQSVVKQDKYSHEDVFTEMPTKPKTKPKPKPKPTKPKPKPVKYTEPMEPVEPPQNEVIEEQEPLPMTYRERKKLERQKLKEEEKERKRIEKEKHREIMAEKNRQKARERYYRIRDEKKKAKEQQDKEIPKQIVEETKSKLNSFQKRDLDTKINNSKNNDIDFATFTNYMLKYEELKHKFNEQRKNEEARVTQQQQQQQSKSPFPANYPIHLLYGNRSKKRNNMF